MIKIENTLWDEDDLKSVIRQLRLAAKKYRKGSKQHNRYVELSNYYAEHLRKCI